jgi:hypothetical protein
MSETQQIKMTSKYFGVTEEKAAEMVREANKRNEETANRAALMREVLKSGQKLQGGIWA